MGYSSGYTATHLEDVSHIWISRVEESDGIIEKMDGIEATLTKLNPADVAVGDEVVTRFTQDGCMYRARVQQISGDLVKVLYFDFGNGEQVSINDLWKMPSNLQDIPPAAVKVMIDGTQGVEDNDTIRAEIENKLFVDDGLQVKLTKAEDGNLTARFGFKDKKIKFSFSKSQSKEVGSNNNQGNNCSPIKEEKEVVKCVEIPKSNSKIVMFNDLPSMKLLAKVEISGAVVNVSPLGTVWFTPTWIQGSLDSLSNKIDESSAHLEPVNPEDVCTNLLCIARNGSDGYLYRAKIVEQLENSVCTVKYIDYGDCEKILISNIFYLPVGLKLMAPAAAEIVLASPPSPLSDCQVKLEETLLERDLVLLLEEEESGVKVGRFFENGNEIKWEGLVDSKTVLEKTHKTQHEEDVVVETESQAKQTTPKEHTAQPVKVDVIQEKATEDVQEKPTEKGKDIQEKPKKLYKVVPASVPADGEECSVFLGYVESVSKVWMCREDDESRINNIMESLASIPGKYYLDNLDF